MRKGRPLFPGHSRSGGECPNERPGERADLAILYEYIKEGLSNYEIMEANPDYMLSLEKIERARQAVREQQYRETFRKLETTCIWGPTGTGKTRFYSGSRSGRRTNRTQEDSGEQAIETRGGG